jgi:hypothetical protein
MKKKYKIAVFNNQTEKVLIDYRRIQIDLDKDGHKELMLHLQRFGAYVGSHKKEGEVVIVPENCTLSTEFKYRWTESGFMALGFGHPRPKPLPDGLSKDRAFYLFMKSVIEDFRKRDVPMPEDCAQWVEYYEDNLKKRNDEFLSAGGKS